jgi:hypothetical protein
MSDRATKPYAALIAAFPAGVTVTRAYDRRGDDVVTFRINGPRVSVAAEIDRIVELCSGRAWLRIMGPCRWGDEWIAHGELRELPEVGGKG